MRFIVLVTAVLCVSAVSAEQKISAYLFGDYVYVAKSNDTHYDGKSGFVARRIYFTYDNDIAENFSARFRMEMEQKDFAASSAAKITPYAKDAYLKWNFNNHALYLGMSPTPTWEVVESFWGYRWLEKTPLDLHNYGSSRDIGLALTGSLDDGKKVGYYLMAAHGAGTVSETDKGKKFYASMVFKPTDKAVFEIYGDFEDSEGDQPNSASYVLQGFAGFEGDFGRIGLQYAYAASDEDENTNITQNIISGFFVAKLGDKTKGVVRVDYLTDPNPNAAEISYIPMEPGTKHLMFAVAGVDLQIAKGVNIQPNAEVVSYGKELATGKNPDAEVIPRLSVYFRF